MVYPGTFDPFTKGHFSVVERALLLCDELHVVAFDNSRKTSILTRTQRAGLIRKALAHLPEVKVGHSDGLVVDYCLCHEITLIVRGVHGPLSFEDELMMADINRLIGGGIETVFLPSVAQTRSLSSSIVREIARLGGDISGMVPDSILSDIERDYGPGPIGYNI